MIFLAIYLGASVVQFVVMGWDKRAARRGRRRVPEMTLHLVELLGGFPGTFLAQAIFRHKTRKIIYRLVLWLIVLVHAAAWGWWLWGRIA